MGRLCQLFKLFPPGEENFVCIGSGLFTPLWFLHCFVVLLWFKKKKKKPRDKPWAQNVLPSQLQLQSSGYFFLKNKIKSR